MSDGTSIPTTPTRAMRHFLKRLIDGDGERTRYDMGSPAYTMPWRMERAGWITCTYDRFSMFKDQIWGHPLTYKITDKGREIMNAVRS